MGLKSPKNGSERYKLLRLFHSVTEAEYGKYGAKTGRKTGVEACDLKSSTGSTAL